MTITINNFFLSIKNIFLIKNNSDHIRQNKFLILLNILILLIPLTLISGPFLSDLSVVVSSIIIILVSIKQKDEKIIFTPVSISFFCFYIYLLIRSLFADNILLSLESSLFFFRFILFFMAVKYIIELNENFLNSFCKVLIFCFLILLLTASLQYFFMFSPFNSEYIGERASGFFGTELIMGSYISRLLPILVGIIFFSYKNNFKQNLLILFILLSSVFLVIISGERTALFNIILFLFLSLFLNKNFSKILVSYIIIISIFSFIIINFNQTIKNRLINLTLKEINYENFDFSIKKPFEKDSLLIFASHHMVLFDKAFAMYNTNKLFGIGPKMFREACSYKEFDNKILPHAGCSTHPHNMYIQLLSETGLLGFIFVFTILIIVTYFLSKQTYGNLFGKYFFSNYKINMLISILITLWPLVPSGNIFHNWTLIIYFLPLGFFLANKDTKKL